METEDRRTVGTGSRVAALALVVALAGSLLLVAAPSAQATGPCDFGRGEDQTRTGVHARRDPVRRRSLVGARRSPDRALHRQAGERPVPWAESSNGINKGLYQQHIDYWGNNFETYTRTCWALKKRILNGRTNAIVSIRMAHAGGWGPWGGSDCG